MIAGTIIIIVMVITVWIHGSKAIMEYGIINIKSIKKALKSLLSKTSYLIIMVFVIVYTRYSLSNV